MHWIIDIRARILSTDDPAIFLATLHAVALTKGDDTVISRTSIKSSPISPSSAFQCSSVRSNSFCFLPPQNSSDHLKMKFTVYLITSLFLLGTALASPLPEDKEWFWCNGKRYDTENVR